MSNLRKIALCDKSAAEQFAPWNRSAEDAAVKAWRALDSFTMRPVEDLRQERAALVEMADMLNRAMEAANG